MKVYKTFNLFKSNSISCKEIFNGLIRGEADSELNRCMSKLSLVFEHEFNTPEKCISKLEKIDKVLIFPSFLFQSILKAESVRCLWYYFASWGWLSFKYISSLDKILEHVHSSSYNLVCILCQLHFFSHMNNCIAEFRCKNADIFQGTELDQTQHKKTINNNEITECMRITVRLLVQEIVENVFKLLARDTLSEYFIPNLICQQLRLFHKLMSKNHQTSNQCAYDVDSFTSNVIQEMYELFENFLPRKDLPSCVHYYLWKTLTSHHESNKIDSKKLYQCQENEIVLLIICLSIFLYQFTGLVEKLRQNEGELILVLDNFNGYLNKVTLLDEDELCNIVESNLTCCYIKAAKKPSILQTDLMFITLSTIFTSLFEASMNAIKCHLSQKLKNTNDIFPSKSKLLTSSEEIKSIKMLTDENMKHLQLTDELILSLKKSQESICASIADYNLSSNSLCSLLAVTNLYHNIFRIIEFQITLFKANRRVHFISSLWKLTASNKLNHFKNILHFIFQVNRFLTILNLMANNLQSNESYCDLFDFDTYSQYCFKEDSTGSLTDFFISAGNLNIIYTKRLDTMFMWHCFILQLRFFVQNVSNRMSISIPYNQNNNFKLVGSGQKARYKRNLVLKLLRDCSNFKALIKDVPSLFISQTESFLTAINSYYIQIMIALDQQSHLERSLSSQSDLVSKNNEESKEASSIYNEDIAFNKACFETNCINQRAIQLLCTVSSRFTLNKGIFNCSKVLNFAVSTLIKRLQKSEKLRNFDFAKVSLLNGFYHMFFSKKNSCYTSNFSDKIFDLYALEPCSKCVELICENSIIVSGNLLINKEKFGCLDPSSIEEILQIFYDEEIQFCKLLIPSNECNVPARSCSKENLYIDSESPEASCYNCETILSNWILSQFKSITELYKFLKQAFAVKLLKLLNPKNCLNIENQTAKYLIFVVYLKLWVRQPSPFWQIPPKATSIKFMAYSVFELNSTFSLLEHKANKKFVFKDFSIKDALQKCLSDTDFKRQFEIEKVDAQPDTSDQNQSVCTECLSHRIDFTETNNNYNILNNNEKICIQNLVDQMGILINDLLESKTYICRKLLRLNILHLVGIRSNVAENLIEVNENVFGSKDSVENQNSSNYEQASVLLNNNYSKLLQSVTLSSQMWPKSILDSEYKNRSTFCDLISNQTETNSQSLSINHPLLLDCQIVKEIFDDCVKDYEKFHVNRTIEFSDQSILVDVQLITPVFYTDLELTQVTTLCLNLLQYYVVKALCTLKKENTETKTILLKKDLEDYIYKTRLGIAVPLPKCIREKVNTCIHDQDISETLSMLYIKNILW